MSFNGRGAEPRCPRPPRQEFWVIALVTGWSALAARLFCFTVRTATPTRCDKQRRRFFIKSHFPSATSPTVHLFPPVRQINCVSSDPGAALMGFLRLYSAPVLLIGNVDLRKEKQEQQETPDPLAPSADLTSSSALPVRTFVDLPPRGGQSSGSLIPDLTGTRPAA